jgi:hypothetical protein
MYHNALLKYSCGITLMHLAQVNSVDNIHNRNLRRGKGREQNWIGTGRAPSRNQRCRCGRASPAQTTRNCEDITTVRVKDNGQEGNYFDPLRSVFRQHSDTNQTPKEQGIRLIPRRRRRTQFVASHESLPPGHAKLGLRGEGPRSSFKAACFSMGCNTRIGPPPIGITPP